MQLLKRAKHLTADIARHRITKKVLAVMAILVVGAILLRPQLTAATAISLNFSGCTAIASRGLKAKKNEVFNFKVTTETDDTFLMEDFEIKHPMKAGKSRVFSVTPTEDKWYSFKLGKCENAGGAVVALKDDGTDSSMGNMSYMSMSHGESEEKEHEGSNKPESEHGSSHDEGQASGANTGDLTNQSQVTIDIKDFAYSKADIKIKKGTKVTWTNQDTVQHNAMRDYSGSGAAHDAPKKEEVKADEFAGPMLAKSESYSFTFNETGSNPYRCSPHPQMKGTITVVD
ncbi:MAG TPA: plastocyanin/azurin family copper-binding protein [Candidatus Limnocylindria bacterium]|nr:plastocyanin/azurin family copper-binding protein [Candidatus Limnocylindria bacterium]